MTLLQKLGIALPLIQAPMAGVSTPELAAAVCNTGALGSLGVAATRAAGALTMIEQLRRLTAKPFNVNLFCHTPSPPDPVREAAWLAAMAPLFEKFGAQPPSVLRSIYKSFVEDDDMLAMLLEQRPAVVSFHFGLPGHDRIAALREAGCILLATATNLEEALAAKAAGIDAIVAQGWEAGGHRGVFDPEAPDDRLGTMALTRLLAVQSGLPVIAAGGIMDGKGIRAALELGAIAAQLGTAFVSCPESSADQAYRDALLAPDAAHTAMTEAISGRPARSLPNAFTKWGEQVGLHHPGYPMTYDAGKALITAAKRAGVPGYAAQWAGQAAALSRPMPAAELVATLAAELGSDVR